MPVLGVTMRGAGYVEGVLRTDVTGDGDDATERIGDAVLGCRAASNLTAVLLQNLMVAGFNTIDIDALHERTGIPVVAVGRGIPDAAAMQRALLAGHIPGGVGKWERLERGLARMGARHDGRLSVAAVGLDRDATDALLEATTVRGLMPEPIRLAHLIAAGWVLGESRGQ